MGQAGSPNTLHATLFGRCPRCGQGALFTGLLNVAPSCSSCGLDYSVFDPGDGPAVFGILIVGAIVAAGALWVEFTFSPPLWVHALIWIPAVPILCLAFLRLAKSLLIVLQYKHQAQEGRRIR
jgi:uncharacterized protein (DUF983 family)